MANKTKRRDFIKDLGTSGVGAGFVSTMILKETSGISENEKVEKSSSSVTVAKRQYNGIYQGDNLDRIAFPIGGIGAGMFCFEGTGAISHMSIRHAPELFNSPVMFAAVTIKGLENSARVIEGPVPNWKKFGIRGAGNGLGEQNYGLPRFHNASFKARFPFADLDLEDSNIPLQARVTSWSPFIPGDPDNASLPVGAIEYELSNNSNEKLEGIFSYNAKNFIQVNNGKNSIGTHTNGFILSEKGTEEQPHLKADFAIFANEPATVDHCWFRGGWFDPMTMLWNSFNGGQSTDHIPVENDAPGASLFIPFNLNPGARKRIKILFAWYVPDSNKTHGNDPEEAPCSGNSDCCPSPPEKDLAIFDKNFEAPFYKPWYASRFKNIQEVCNYWLQNYADLYQKSKLFSDTFYASTLPAEVMEAIAANLTILKSTTVMRQYDGRFYTYEGSGDNWGCCHGSCTHVWNYAQAIPHLFPSLERSLRHTEFCESQNSEGHQTFRANLPIRPVDHGFHAAADGQLGGIMKVYREWRISGDNEWIAKMYPMVKASLDYCIKTWDPRHSGALEEPHHNTYDIEFWGPDGMCTSFYLGALYAFIEMTKHLNQDASSYKTLLEKSINRLENELFDGEYFIQKIRVEGLNAANPVEASKISMGGIYSEEALQLLQKEGPKYQYGTGCLSDGILGMWIARMCGLPDIIASEKIGSHLLAVHKYNLKEDLSTHINPQRPSFAMGEEAGLLLCSWPKGGKLSLPFVYSNEVWTGIEYQVAAHLMLMGHPREGLDIVQACRDRYTGIVRNPFNEYECGSWYARAMSSYGMIQGLTGLFYDAVERILYVDSKIGDFSCFLATDSGYGLVHLRGEKASLEVVSGEIKPQKIVIGKGIANR
ncbi:MAG: hypothetical protein IPL46_19690 [Saprospiraceae bacterium]|nr:hypothetical protein [Saprospiraceae bacterium]